MTASKLDRRLSVFNDPVEVGLRGLVLLTEAFPNSYSLLKLVVFDYLIVHSDDLPNGPTGLHPKTPHRSGELLVRRELLQKGLRLYESRGLIQPLFQKTGIHYVATEYSASFLDVLTSKYATLLRDRARWLINCYGTMAQEQLDHLVHEHLGEWGAEFAMESILWEEPRA